MPAISPPPAPPLGSIEALKRVKETETDWELRLRIARGIAEEALERLRADCDAAVKTARATAEADRTRAVQAAKADADRQAAAILAEGNRAAEAAAQGEGKHPADKKEQILAAVLAGFAKD